jgi:hypothetical protein
MKTSRHLHLTLLIAAATLSAAPLHAATPEEQAVLAPIQAMFDGMAKRDAAAIKEPLLPGGTMVLMRDGKPAQMTFEAFAERVGKPGTTNIEERIHDPLIRIDNDLAMVWHPSTSSSTAKSTTAEPTSSTSSAKTASGSSQASPTPAAKIARRNSFLF